MLAGVCVVLVVAGFYGEEDWRGWHAWNEYKADAVARGLSLDYASYIPKPVPDEENFAATPYLKAFMGPGPVTLAIDAYDYPHGIVRDVRPSGVRELGRRRFIPLENWKPSGTAIESNAISIPRAIVAATVLDGMKPYADMFAQLSAASNRKFGQFAVQYNVEKPWETAEPHFIRIEKLCGHLQLHACAELAADRAREAMADVKVMLALADSIKMEPSLISFLIRAACFRFTIQPVWEGLAEHRWNEGQLQELQARFSSYNFVADMDRIFKAERAAGTLECDEIGMDGFVPGGWLFPSGWYGLEKVNYNHGLDKMKGTYDPIGITVSPKRCDAITKEFRQWPDVAESGITLAVVINHEVVEAMRLPSSSPTVSAAAQVESDEAALACALERYRLANGQFPERLDALMPRFMAHLPNDVITGQPYKYRRTADGRFVLYSVGWNEKDDGGVPGDTLFDKEKGDWVWEYPGKE